MRYDSQSKSAIMAKGQASEFHLVAYTGLDYRITICNEEILGSQIQFRIYEKVKTLINEHVEVETSSSSDTSSYSDNYSDDYSNDSYSNDDYGNSEDNGDKPKYTVVKELLYDNADNNYSNFLEFTADGTKSFIIEIVVPGDSGGSISKLKIREMGCVGVLIEHAKSRQSGF